MRINPFFTKWLTVMSVCALAGPIWLNAGSLYFNGTPSNYVDFGDVLNLGGNFTVRAWVFIENGAPGGNGGSDPISKVNSHLSPVGGWELGMQVSSSPNKCAFLFNSQYVGSGPDWYEFLVEGANADSHGAWHNLASTYDGNTLCVLWDGAVTASNMIGAHAVLSTPHDLMIGGNSDTNCFLQGWIDEVSVWSIAQPPSEILNSLYTPLTGNETGLEAYWNFNEGSGSTLHDQQALHRYDGAIVGAIWATPDALVPPGYDHLSGQLLTGGDVRLSFVGMEGTNYALDRSYSLSPASWVPQTTNAAGPPAGVLLFTNTPNPTTNNFWRVRSVP